MITMECSMLARIADLMLGAVSRAAALVADDDYRLVLTPRFGGLILPSRAGARALRHADR
jgi:hypothetical protein